MPVKKEAWPEGTPAWVDLMVPDFAAAKAFYTGVFGWEFSESGEEFGYYAVASVDGEPVAGIGPVQGPDGPHRFLAPGTAAVHEDRPALVHAASRGNHPARQRTQLTANRHVPGRESEGDIGWPGVEVGVPSGRTRLRHTGIHGEQPAPDALCHRVDVQNVTEPQMARPAVEPEPVSTGNDGLGREIDDRLVRAHLDEFVVVGTGPLRGEYAAREVGRGRQ